VAEGVWEKHLARGLGESGPRLSGWSPTRSVPRPQPCRKKCGTDYLSFLKVFQRAVERLLADAEDLRLVVVFV